MCWFSKKMTLCARRAARICAISSSSKRFDKSAPSMTAPMVGVRMRVVNFAMVPPSDRTSFGHSCIQRKFQTFALVQQQLATGQNEAEAEGDARRDRHQRYHHA